MRVTRLKESSNSTGVNHASRTGKETLHRKTEAANSIIQLHSMYGNRQVAQWIRTSSSALRTHPIQRSWQTSAMSTEHERIKNSTSKKEMAATLHHIIPREKMEKIAKYAKDDNTEKSKAFLELMVEIYEDLLSGDHSGVAPSKAIQNLPFNLTPGPAAEKVLNNPGAAYDPQTVKVDMDPDEVEENFGFTAEQLDGLEYEYREDTGISNKLLAILNLVNNTGERDDEFWKKMIAKFEEIRGQSFNSLAEDEWTKNGTKDEYTRKRAGLNITEDKDNVLKGLLRKLPAPDEEIVIAIPETEDMKFDIKPIKMKHILERHCIPYFAGQVMGENSFFPLQMSKDDIKKLIKEKVEAKVGKYLASFKKQIEMEEFDEGDYRFYEINGNDVELTFSDGESYIYFSTIFLGQSKDDKIEAEATIATYAPQGPDSIHIPTQVLEAALEDD